MLKVSGWYLIFGWCTGICYTWVTMVTIGHAKLGKFLITVKDVPSHVLEFFNIILTGWSFNINCLSSGHCAHPCHSDLILSHPIYYLIYYFNPIWSLINLSHLIKSYPSYLISSYLITSDSIHLNLICLIWSNLIWSNLI